MDCMETGLHGKVISTNSGRPLPDPRADSSTAKVQVGLRIMLKLISLFTEQDVDKYDIYSPITSKEMSSIILCICVYAYQVFLKSCCMFILFSVCQI